MTVVQALALGVLQGVAEFIPISSSGHLVVMRHLMGLGEIPVLFDVILHIATLVVVFFVFRERIARILVALWRWATRRADADDLVQVRLAGYVVIATICTVVIGLAIAEARLDRFPKLVSALFLVTAAILIAAHFFHGSIDYDGFGIRHALITGIAQGIAVLPGISRSGLTITAALAAGIDRTRAGEFSFLISIPAILGALVLTLRDLGALTAVVSVPALAAGFLASLVVGFFSLVLLLKLIRGGKLYLFAIYLVPLGIAGLILF
ncbi:MAG: undecaprenyl-diphosphate phosphatase [Spirochaetaceae bacterium]|nr:MAG: undecaprenyl-diphosphate phosphatase [Spirochaetaceae bacterium]